MWSILGVSSETHALAADLANGLVFFRSTEEDPNPPRVGRLVAVGSILSEIVSPEVILNIERFRDAFA